MNENYLKTPIDLLIDKVLNPTDKLIAQYLLWRQGGNGHCWPAERTIAIDLNLNLNTVQNSIARLAKNKKISIQKPQKRGRGHSNRYSVIDLKNQSIESNCIKKSVSIDLKNQSVIDLKNSTENKPYKSNHKKEPHTPEAKTKYLDFVYLTDEEYRKLLDQFGEAILKEKITELNNGIGSKGYKYKSHYFTILSWDRKNEKNKFSKPERRDYRVPVESGFGQTVAV
ncbi:MAG: hypothetical protein A2Y10_19640 [Planctomycetes bacterium GWF2_41_51]|nr:MAG: hypothetical protein A2Y10_19640 [Planctomycetes bacterium GWF2_41_51]